MFSLLNKLEDRKTEWHSENCLKQLQHMNRITWSAKAEDVFTLPLFYNSPVDNDMLSAIDIMLDLTDTRVLKVSAPGPPFKLRFLTERKDRLNGYVIASVLPGGETRAAALINESAQYSDRLPLGITVIILLPDMSLAKTMRLNVPHYFAIRGTNGYRYFEPGGG